MKPHYWDEAHRSLGRADPVMRRLIRRHPDVHLQRRGEAFSTLARAIVGQQISVKAAQTIWDRFAAAACGSAGRGESDPSIVTVDARRVGRMRLPTLRRCGLSQRKAE